MRVGVTLMIAAAVASVVGCRQSSAPTPVADGTPPTAPAAPAPRREPITFTVAGSVADHSGAPIAGAKVTILVGFDDQAVFTGPQGLFRLEYTAVPGAEYHPGYDPIGAAESIGFLQVEAPGYERFARHLLATGPELVEDVRLHRITRVAAGGSVTVTIRPEDTVCGVDAWPGREFTCGIVRVEVPSAGILRVEAAPRQPGGSSPALAVYGGYIGAPRANPTFLRVTPGEYFVNVEVPWRAPTQSFEVRTSLETDSRVAAR